MAAETLQECLSILNYGAAPGELLQGNSSSFDAWMVSTVAPEKLEFA